MRKSQNLRIQIQKIILVIFFETKLPMQSKFFHYDTTGNPIEKQAFQDAISLIGYMYHNAEAILKSSKSLLSQILTTTKEGLSTSWDDIKKTTPGNVEYDLWQIEKQVPESEIITEKAKSGQLKSIKIPYVSIDFSISYLPTVSLSGIRRGIEDFLKEKYCADKFTKEEQGCFILFLGYKIFRYGNEECLEYFSEKQPKLITKTFNDHPHLFFRKEAINACIKNEDDRQKALDAIKLKSSDKFFVGCFDTVFPKVDVVVNRIFEEEPKPKFEHGPVFDSDPIEVIPLNIDENDDVLPTGNV